MIALKKALEINKLSNAANKIKNINQIDLPTLPHNMKIKEISKNPSRNKIIAVGYSDLGSNLSKLKSYNSRLNLLRKDNEIKNAILGIPRNMSLSGGKAKVKMARELFSQILGKPQSKPLKNILGIR